MLATISFFISFSLAFLFIVSLPVQAQSFVLPAGLQASWCSTNWSVSGSTYTCSNNGKVTFPNDAVVSSAGAIVFVANAGFELNNAKLGSESSNISLRAPNGGALVKSAVGAVVSGFIETLGAVDLKGTKVGKYIKANGEIDLVGGSVAGDVETINSGVKASGVVFGGGITANGDINLTGGSVEGRVTSTANKIFTQDTSLLGGATAHSGMSIKGDGNTIIKGDFLFTSLNAAYFEGVKMISGSSIGTAGTAYFKDSVIGTPTNPVNVRVDGSANVELENSTIYGMVHVPDYGQWSPLIRGDSKSNIYGECLRFSGGARPLSDPARLCDGTAVPPDPPDSVECGVSLEVGPMIAGKPHYATVTALDEPPSCETPSSLKILFKYLNPDPEHHNHESIWVDYVEIKEGEAREISNVDWSQKEARLDVEYKEAGELYLAVLGADDEILSEDSFVARPYGFCIKPLLEAPISEGGSAESIDFESSVRFRAGYPVSVSITAVRWDGNGGAGGSVENPLLAKLICGNDPTRNYRQDKSTLFRQESKLIQPASGEPAEVVGSFKHVSVDDGFVAGVAIASVTFSDVGFFRIQMDEPPKYLGEDMSASISESMTIGRIIPAWLQVGERPTQNLGCPQSSDQFTYQGQSTSLTGELQVWGINRDGDQTQNYKGDFWRFAGTLEYRKEENDGYEFHRNSAIPKAGQLSAIFDRIKPASEDTEMPVFTATPSEAAFLPSSDDYSYIRPSTPTELDNPFSLKMVIWNWHDQDGVYFKRDDEQPEDERGFEPDGAVPVEALIGTSEFRLGRIRTQNIIDPGLGEPPIVVDIPLRLEHWEDSSFVLASDDCTSVESVIESVTSNLTSAEVVEQVDFSAEFEKVEKVQVRVSGPENRLNGSVSIKSLLSVKGATEKPYWLCQAGIPIQGGVCTYSTVVNEEGLESVEVRADATATFGIYQGPKPLIFRRELYRGM